MRKIKAITQVVWNTVIISLLSYFSFPRSINGDPPDQDTISKYVDGTYVGYSQNIYKDEPYWGRVKVRISEGKITVVDFSIRDSSLHETFNQYYEKHFDSIPLYVQQCRNDWEGVKSYPRKLLNTQDISKVDAVSGATWSYNIFRSAVDSALKKAVLK